MFTKSTSTQLSAKLSGRKFMVIGSEVVAGGDLVVVKAICSRLCVVYIDTQQPAFWKLF